MGEAKRKRVENAAAIFSNTATKKINISHVAASVRHVVEAITDYHGADCLLYAHIGARMLNYLGVEAKPVAGSAAWRVGDGDADVISHAREVTGALYSQASPELSLLFHAWIETRDFVIDFSTFSLTKKALQLDAADGGRTDVSWCPEFICQTKRSNQTGASNLLIEPNIPGKSGLSDARKVLMAPRAGVFNYTRHADIEARVLPISQENEPGMATATFSAQAVYKALERGEEIVVIGVSEDGGMQHEPAHRDLIIQRPTQ